MPAVFIGIPFRNPGDCLRLAVQSVFAQNYTDWRLVLMDDGSTDGSAEWARRVFDQRVSFVSDGMQRNLNIRLNQLIEMADCEYFCRMDADDVMHPQRLSRQVEALRNAPLDTVVGSAAYSIDQRGNVIGRRGVPHRQRSGFAARYSFIHPSVAARTAWFKQNKYSSSTVFHRCQDGELWCRTTGRTVFVNLPEPLLYYREVNCFSLANQVSTLCGSIVILSETCSGSTLWYAWELAALVGRVWVYGICDRLGIVELITRNRLQRINQKEARAAEHILRKLSEVPVPFEVSR